MLALYNAARPPVAKSVAIAMHTYFSSRWLSPRLTGFMVDNPEIALRIQPINVAADLEGRDVDLAAVIDGQGIALWDGLVQKEIAEGLLCFV